MIRSGDRCSGEGVLPGGSVTARAAHEALPGDRRGIRRVWPFLGPAFIACVAYVEPGNFATNVSGGAQFGYLLLWVVLTSNLMSMLVQSVSAKLARFVAAYPAVDRGEAKTVAAQHPIVWVTREAAA